MNIYVVDDEEELRASLATMLGQGGHQVQTFASGGAFLSVAEDLSPGCVLLDLCLPDMDGLKLQEELARQGSPHSVVLLSGYGDIPDAVSAMRAGAIDFLRKPYRRAELFAALERAGERLSAMQETAAEPSVHALMERLTEREMDVLSASAEGEATKQVAFNLGLSVRTVEMHRSNILRKLEVTNFAKALLIANSARVDRN